MNRDQFTRLEERIEQLVEGSFARVFGSRLHPREVAVKLARAVEDNVTVQTREGESEGDVLYAPNVFNLLFQPDDLDALVDTQPDLAALLADTVIDLAYRAGLRLDRLPLIRLIPDSSVAARGVQIEAFYEADEKHATQVLEELAAPPERAPRNPQLLVAGARYVPLDRPVLNIGRRHNNHIVIDDPRVSRAHAQLRLRFGYYVLYDLGSRGGTLVNNHRVSEAILHPGDVISLAGVMLIYVEDETNSGHLARDTQVRPPEAKPPPSSSDPTL